MAIGIAKELGAEIISFDSRQFYQEIPIGTAAPTEAERSEVPHHFILDRSIHQPLNAADFAKEALNQIENLHQKHDQVVLVGGSGLYIKALLEGFDEMPDISPELRESIQQEYADKGLDFLQSEIQAQDPNYAAEVDMQNPQRLMRALEVIRESGQPYSSFRKSSKRELNFKVQHFGLSMDRSKLYDRINRRVGIMVDLGLIEEAQALIDYQDINALQTVGYKELFPYFEGKYDLKTALEEIRKNSRRYAKRQITWFKRDASINWVESDNWQAILKDL